MRYTLKMLFVIFSITFLLCTTGFSTNITIYDGSGETDPQPGLDYEDNETEPGTVNSQIWDLEAFLLNGTNLTMVGGYDFDDGVDGVLSGDIFIKTTDGAPAIGARTNPGKNDFGYDFVIDLDFSKPTYTYEVFSINETAEVEYSYYSQNSASDPWRYVLDQDNTSIYSGEIVYLENVSDTGFLGKDGNDKHNTVTVALDFLGKDTAFYAHFTMQCGNDNLMGYGTIHQPEPATMLLFGFGLLGIARIGRKKITG